MKIRMLILLGCLSLMCSHLTLASVGKVIIAKGEVYALDVSNVSRPLKRRSEVHEGDTLVTGGDGEIHIRFQDNAVLALRAQSQLKISEYHAASAGGGEKVLMELLSGGFRTITGAFGKTDKEAYQIRTPNASIGIRGTNYEAVLSNNALLVGVYQGGVELNNSTGSINLGLDSAFSFAQVGSANAPIQGLMQAPAELSQPLTPMTNDTEANRQTSDEPSALLSQEDEKLISQALTTSEGSALNQPTTANVRRDENTLVAVKQPQASEDDISSITQANDLQELADVRLTQQQIASLKAGAPVGIVVVNQDPVGYRLPVYTLSNGYTSNATDFSSSGPNSFDVTLKTDSTNYTYTIELSNLTGTSLIAELESQLGAPDDTQINDIDIPARVEVKNVNGKLVFTGYTDSSGAEIIINNFQGDDAVYIAQALGLCTTTCSGTYDLGAPSVGSYEHATHFGYVVEGENGPVFVNYESESITVLANGYRAPDNVFIGNEQAQKTTFDSIDTNADGTDDIDWGYWAASEASPSVLLKDSNDLSAAENVSAAHFYAVAAPAPASQLIGQKTMSTTMAWHASNSIESGLLSHENTTATLSSVIDVDFATGLGIGNIEFSSSDSSWTWALNHQGQVNGAQYQSDWGRGTLVTNNTTTDAVGHVDGIFTSTDTGIGLLGGFGIQTTNDTHHVEGVFLTKE